MRIIGGSLRGRRFEAPSGSLVRPTSDRVREAIFNILGPPAPDTRVLDAFAGAGSLGMEALSRGARDVLFIDRARASLDCLRRNLNSLGIDRSARVRRGDAHALVQRWQRGDGNSSPGRFRWVFLDPPYKGDAADRMLDLLGAGDLLETDAVIVVEHDRRNPPGDDHGSLERTDRRKYGDTSVSFYGLKSSHERLSSSESLSSSPSQPDLSMEGDRQT